MAVSPYGYDLLEEFDAWSAMGGLLIKNKSFTTEGRENTEEFLILCVFCGVGFRFLWPSVAKRLETGAE